MSTFAADLLTLVTSTVSGAADDAAPILLVLIGISLSITLAFGFWRLSKKGTGKALG